MAHNDKRSPHTDALETLGTIIGPEEKRDAIHLAVYPVIANANFKAGDYVQLDGTGRAIHAQDVENAVGIVDPFIMATTFPYASPRAGTIERGSRFWLVVLPRTIRSLRHVWEHPAFPASTETGDDVKAAPEAPAIAGKGPDDRRAIPRGFYRWFGMAEIGADEPAWTELPTAEFNERVDAAVAAWDRITAYAESLSGEDYDDEYRTVTAEELMEHAVTWLPGKGTRWGGDYLVKGGLLEGTGTDPKFWDDFEIITGTRPEDDKSPSFFSCSC